MQPTAHRWGAADKSLVIMMALLSDHQFAKNCDSPGIFVFINSGMLPFSVYLSTWLSGNMSRDTRRIA
jgi:hypothetical protein